VGAALALTLAAGCAGSEGGGPEVPDGEPDQVVFLTSFGASAHDAFVFVADEMGFFEQAGIEVEIRLGAGAQNYPLLLSGEAQFTYIDVTSVLYSIGTGDLEPDDFAVLSAVHHQTLVAILVPEDIPDVSTPADLEGKTIGVFGGSPTDFLMPAYAEMSGWAYDDSLVQRVSPQDLFTLFAARQFEIASTFIIQKGVFESPGVLDMPTTAFPFNEYLDDLLGTGLMTTTALADENPDLAIRFRDAAIEGLRYTLENPEEAIQILQSREPEARRHGEPPPFLEEGWDTRDLEGYARGAEAEWNPDVPRPWEDKPEHSSRGTRVIPLLLIGVVIVVLVMFWNAQGG
jgi:NitT/TauT family transport system substrate-binding protein